MVTTPEVSAVRDADRIIGLLQSEEIHKIDLIINRLNPKMVAKGDMLDSEDVLDILSINLIGVIPEDSNIVGSTNRGQPLIHDSKTGAAGAYRRISDRIEGKEVPIPEFKVDGTFARFWGKLLGKRDGEIS